MEVLKPRSLADTLAMLGEVPGSRVIAGGTDLVPQLGTMPEDVSALVDVSDLSELQEVYLDAGFLVVGSAVSHATLAVHPLVRVYAPLLASACARVGSPQVRNRGTLGGNLGTASPAGDTLPALAAMEAVLQLRHRSAARDLPIGQFLLGPKQTALRAGEIVAGVRIPCRRSRQTGFYYKVGARRSGSIALASAAGWMRLTPAGCLESIGVALGSVGPTVVSARRLVQLLIGSRPGNQELWEAVSTIAEEVQPIDDIRASADYRRQLVVDLVHRGITAALARVS